MSREGVNLIRHYLVSYPEFNERLRADPLRVLSRGRWRRITAVRFLKNGLELQTQTGALVRLYPRSARTARRQRFRADFLKALKRDFPHWKIAKILDGTDRNRHQTEALMRIEARSRSRLFAAVVVGMCEDRSVTDRVLSASILWWHQLRRSERRGEKRAGTVVIFVPEGWSDELQRSFLRLTLPIICYEYRTRAIRRGENHPAAFRKIYPRPIRSSSIRSPYVVFPYHDEIPAMLEQLKKRHPFLDFSFRHGRWELSFRGLKVAWCRESDGRCFFDAIRPKAMDGSVPEAFEGYLKEVVQFRSFPPRDSTHPYYSLYHERWLESLILRNPRLLNRNFKGEIYSQVPTCLDGQRKILDLLARTVNGRLAVVELKVEKHLDILFQALDYWERVSYHLQRGDFQRAGYFSNVKLSKESPLLYIVSPLFEFHRVIPVLRGCLTTEIEIRCVGINLRWRQDLRVLRKFTLW